MPSEQKGGNVNQSRADGLLKVTDHWNMININNMGGNFTWHRNCWGERKVSKKLDRGMCNVEWRLFFSQVFIEVLCRFHSGYNPFSKMSYFFQRLVSLRPRYIVEKLLSKFVAAYGVRVNDFRIGNGSSSIWFIP